MSGEYGDRFVDRTAIVTGGGSGIGAALTRALAAAGARVYCTDINETSAKAIAAEAHGPGSVEAVALDVTDAAAVQRLVDDVVEKSGRIDLIFNNAGIVVGGETQLLTLEQWNRIIDINLRGVVHGVHAAYPHMIAQGSGHIVNTASGAGLLASGLVTSYSATKFAVVGLSNALRAEAAVHGVGVTVVCPSIVETPILDVRGAGGFHGRDFFFNGGKSTDTYSPEELVADILSAVVRDDAWVVTPRRMRLSWYFNRIAPGVFQRLMSRYVRQQITGGKAA